MAYRFDLRLARCVSVRYERDEAKPTIDVVVRMAKVLDTSVSYLLGENESADLFKDPNLLRRFKDIANFDENDREHIFYTLDALINNVKLRSLSR